MTEQTEGMTIPQGELAKISAMAMRMQTLESEINDLQSQIKERTDELQRIENADLPDALEAVNMAEFKLETGEKVQVQSIVRASLPTQTGIDRAKGDEKTELQERLVLGLEWLRANNSGDVIKNEIAVNVGKGNDEKAAKIVALAEELALKAVQTESVHPGTLSSLVKEKIANGAVVPFELLGVYTGRKAKITKSA